MRHFAVAALVVVLATAGAPQNSAAQISIGIAVNITVEPPELPDYDQPEIPGPGYLWTPGYWAWGDDGYYWVPGTWVEPPVVGVLWTPGYWGYGDGGVYVFHEGYWGPHIGFYGGVSYGFGYVGTGYVGGQWRGGVFAYNTAVTNVGSVHITNVYNQTVINNVSVTKVSFNGGPNGVAAQPTAQEQAAAREQHVPPTAAQTQHATAASHNRSLLASVNHGKPAIAATGKPGQFSGHGVIAARPTGKEFHAPNNGSKPGNVNAVTTRPNSGPNPNVQHEEHAATPPHPNVATGNPPKPNPPKPPAPPKPAAAAKPHGPPPKKDKKG
jgi:hypothetical protein